MRLLTGVARAKAQGQAMIKTEIALIKEISTLACLKKNQKQKEKQ